KIQELPLLLLLCGIRRYCTPTDLYCESQQLDYRDTQNTYKNLK
ncbi:46160_t:CDS:1, partial [Gigaspora margarita]